MMTERLFFQLILKDQRDATVLITNQWTHYTFLYSPGILDVRSHQWPVFVLYRSSAQTRERYRLRHRLPQRRGWLMTKEGYLYPK